MKPDRSKGLGADKSQSEKFKDAARKAGADEDEAAFEDKLKRLAKAKPKSPQDKQKSSGSHGFNDEAIKRAEQKLPRNWRDD